MNTESVYRLAFLLLLLLLLAMRVYFMIKVRRSGGRILPDEEAVQREGGRGMLAVRVIGFVALMSFLILYIAGAKWIDIFRFVLPAWLRWAGFGVGVISVAFWTWVQVVLDTQWSAQLQLTKDHHLITSGPYARIRHPLYAGLFGWCVALILLTANWIFTVICALVFLGLLWRIPREERMMLEAFGQEYRDYIQHTGRLLPRLFSSGGPMAEKISPALGGISETLLMTLYVRARETERPDGMIRDEKALDMVRHLDCDFSRLRMQRHDQVAVILRMRKFDSYVSDFLRRHPEGVVVHIGCGLDTRFERVDNGYVEWFDLDLPAVLNLREQLIRNECCRYHTLATSVLEDGWIGQVSWYKPRPFMFIAEGVLPYFEEADVKALFLKLREYFSGCELVCDAHTPFVLWADNLQLAYAKVDARLRWAIKNGREVEGWADGIRLLDEWNYFEEDEPRLKAVRWARHVPALAKSSGIFHYRLGA